MKKQQIRRGVFETNSSSEHAIAIHNHIAILTNEEYALYLAGDLKVSPYGKITQPEEYNANIQEITEKALARWKKCGKDEYPKSLFHSDRKNYIDGEVYQYDMSVDVKRYHYGREIFENEREINGETVHVLSICDGEEYEYFNG